MGGGHDVTMDILIDYNRAVYDVAVSLAGILSPQPSGTATTNTNSHYEP